MGVKGRDDAYVDITIFTTEAIYKYELFSMYDVDADADYRTMSFLSPSAFLNYLNERQDLSKWSKDIQFWSSDKIITFSTCPSTGFHLTGDKRMAYHAILVDIQM